MFRKATLFALSLVATGCGGSGGGSSASTSQDFLVVLNEEGGFLRRNPFGGPTQRLNSVSGYYGAVSPDGSTLAYSTNGIGGFQLRLVGTDGANDRKLIDLDSDTPLSFFSAGQEIAFVGGTDAENWLYAVNVQTGAVRNVVQLPKNELLAGGGVCVDPLGKWVAITSGWGDDSISHVVLVSLADGSKTDLGRGARPKFSEDGQRLAFIDGERNLVVWERTTSERIVSDLNDPVREIAFDEGEDAVYVSTFNYDDDTTQRYKVGHVQIGSQTPTYLPQQEKTTYLVIASVKG